MSVCSRRTSHVSIMRNSMTNRTSFFKSYVKIQEKVVENALRECFQNNNVKPYEDLARTLRDVALSESEATILFDDCSLCVGIMGRECKLLVEVLFTLKWNVMSESAIKTFSKWVLSLLTAHIYHTPMAFGSLLKLLTENVSIWSDHPSAEQSTAYSHVHNLIAQIVSAIPMSANVLIQCAIDNFPYYKSNSATHQAYVHNLLWITRYLPSLEMEFLTLVLNRLIVMDVNIGNPNKSNINDGVFDMDIEEKTDEVLESLDLCMVEVFYWIDQYKKDILDLLFPVFQKVILPTYGSRNVQFILLYGLSKNINKVSTYLEVLWQLVPSARVGPDPRQASISHLTGLLARSSFISPILTKTYISKMAEWCHSYIKAQEISNSHNGKNPHAVFYSVCQCLFYLIAFNHKELFSDKTGIMFVVSLNLSKIVMCSLNPLRRCHEGISEAFASITRIHQIVYCHTIMEQNVRRHLKINDDKVKHQEWFPYDPYNLPKSSKWIQPVYREYEEMTSDRPNRNMEICDEDDFLATSPNLGYLAKSSFNSLRHIN